METSNFPLAESAPLLLFHAPPVEPGLRHLWIGLRRSSILLLIYIILFVMFMVGGAFVFSQLELPGEQKIRRDMLSELDKFLTQHPCVSEDDLESLLAEVVRANNRGVAASRNVSNEPNWSFGQSFFFAGTVITTIGYGHVTPLSEAGKVFCMVYALVGIPMTLMLLSALVDRLMVPTTKFLQWMNARFGHLHQPFHLRLFHLVTVTVVLATFFFLIPAAIFDYLEPDWNYLDSLYYCFISLTTIGLGDYIPGDSPDQPLRPLYKILTTVYLIAGLVFMVLTLTVFYDIPQLNVGNIFLLKSDEYDADFYASEKSRIQPSSGSGNLSSQSSGYPYAAAYGTTSYTNAGMETEDEGHRQKIRIPIRKGDSPSPEETTPVHARQ